MRASRPRVVMFAPHFIEYALRTAMGLARHADVLAIVDEHALHREVSDILGLTHPAVRILPIDFGTRGEKRFDINALVAEIAAFDPDVIHHQEQLPQVSVALMMRFRSALQVLMAHDPLPHTGAIFELPPRTREFILRLRGMADLVLVHGADNERQLRSATPRISGTVRHTHHGIVLAPPPALRHPPDERRLLLFGHLHAYKGMDVLLEACALLARRGVRHSLTIAGSGPEPARLASGIAALPDVTVHSGFQTPEAAIRLFQQASVVVLPYRDATQSGVLASAFANGRTVVATRTGDMPLIARDGDNGLLVPPGDAPALAAALERLLEDPELLARLTQGAVRTATETMGWDAIADTMFQHYLEEMARRNGPPR